MLAERTVRRLSIRAPADALARRAGWLIEDALRTATLPGDGAEIVLLRQLRLPPFAPGASPQQVAMRLEAACRAAIAVDGTQADDAVLAAAPVVRFADALSAHVALGRLVLANAARRAWCWPLVVKGYRPELGGGAALRALALSLAGRPEAPAALPAWLEMLVTHGEGSGCAALLRALSAGDAEHLQQVCLGARPVAAAVSSARWRALLAWSSAQLGVDDHRHRWLSDMAALCGVDDQHRAVAKPTGDRRGADASLAGEAVVLASEPGSAAAAGRAAASAGGEPSATAASGLAPGLAAESADAAAGAPREGAMPDAAAAAGNATGSQAAPAAGDAIGQAGSPRLAEASASRRAPAFEGGGRQADAPLAGDWPVAPTAVSAGKSADRADRRPPAGDVSAPTAAGGLLYLVPLLSHLGLADFLRQEGAARDLPQHIFATLLRRLPIAADDPLWRLAGGPPAIDGAAVAEIDREAAHWLTHCRRYLRRRIGIGLHSLVCRPARVAITATHIDVCQDLDTVDLRIRRAGLDIDPGWVAWLGRVLRFHYGGDWR